MKKVVIPLVISFLTFFTGWAQDSTKTYEIPGKPILKVFGNFHKGIMESDQSSAFEIKRAYFGYKFNLEEHFKAEVKLDIGSPDDVSENSLKRRFSYFKTAALTYHKNKLKVNLGLIGMNQFSVQEKFWEHRYIYKSFQDEHKFGPSADIGFSAAYKINDYISVDGSYTNGEGYSKLQSDDAYKTALGITASPIKNIVFRSYYDIIDEGNQQQNLALFCGFSMTNFKLGAEYYKQFNHNSAENHNLEGYSAYGMYNLGKKYEIFARYDYLQSNKIDGEINPWNIENDGTAFIAGLQYKMSKRIRMSLNYQDWYEAAKDGTDIAMIYFSFEFKY